MLCAPPLKSLQAAPRASHRATSVALVWLQIQAVCVCQTCNSRWPDARRQIPQAARKLRGDARRQRQAHRAST